MGIPITLAELPAEIQARLDKYVPDAIQKGTLLAAHRGRTTLVRKSPVDQGHFKNAWKVQNRPQDKKGRLNNVWLENMAPHAGIIEKGARPHAVSFEGFMALLEWARRHGVKGDKRFKPGKKRRLQGPVQEVTYYKTTFYGADVASANLAMGIVRKLNKHGQKGKYIVRDNKEKLEKYVKAEVQKRIKAGAKKRALGPGGSAP